MCKGLNSADSGIDVRRSHIPENETIAAHGREDRDLDETKVEVALRKSARGRKPNSKYAKYVSSTNCTEKV